jgi:hypothetical protein
MHSLESSGQDARVTEDEAMNSTRIALGLGLCLAAALPASAEIIKGVMAIKGAEMS